MYGNGIYGVEKSVGRVREIKKTNNKYHSGLLVVMGRQVLN